MIKKVVFKKYVPRYYKKAVWNMKGLARRFNLERIDDTELARIYATGVRDGRAGMNPQGIVGNAYSLPYVVTPVARAARSSLSAAMD